MLFNKYTVLALSAFTSVAALRVNRDLTVCPTDKVIGLTCTVYLDGNGDGRGPWTEVGSVSAPNTLTLNSFDPDGCYNIFCESTDDIDTKRLTWLGFEKAGNNTTGMKVSPKTPFYLSGASTGNGCSKLAPSCKDLDITLQATRAAYPGVTDLEPYICAEAKIQCKEPEPPVAPPVTPPVSSPVEAPVAPPVTPPVCPPVAPPVAPPVTPPVGGCPTPQYELRCVESVNPSGKHIPTAGTSLDPKVSPHQNPDGFYTFGFVDTCGEPTCIEGIPVRLFSGLGPNGEMDNLSEFTSNIKNLRNSDQRGYWSCDTVKYTQFADGKKDTEKKIGSDPANVRAHLQGSGDMVVKAIDPDGNEQVAFCRVPKPPARA